MDFGVWFVVWWMLYLINRHVCDLSWGMRFLVMCDFHLFSMWFLRFGLW